MGSEHDAEMTSDTNSAAPAERTMRAIVQDAYGSPGSALLMSRRTKCSYAFMRLVWIGARGI